MHTGARLLLSRPSQVVNTAGVTDSKLLQASEVQQRVMEHVPLFGSRVAGGMQIEGGVGDREAFEAVQGGQMCY